MKKILSLAFVLTMLLTALLAGCQQENNSTDTGDTGGPPEKVSLTADELAVWTDRLKSEVPVEGKEEDWTASEINGFFLSDWNDPRELDFFAFISCFPVQTLLNSGDEGYEELMEAYEDKYGEAFNHDVPTHAIKISDINSALTEYARINVDDLEGDWKNGEAYIYLPENDTVYTFVSDYGPGEFVPLDGSREGDVLTLNSSDHTLTIRESDNTWRLLSHLPKE